MTRNEILTCVYSVALGRKQLVWIANTLTGFVFNFLGFTRYDRTIDQTHDFERDEPAPLDVAHWYRAPANPENKTPLVFIHGIGGTSEDKYMWFNNCDL